MKRKYPLVVEKEILEKSSSTTIFSNFQII